MIQTKRAKEIARDIHEQAGKQHKKISYMHLIRFAESNGEQYVYDYLFDLIETLNMVNSAVPDGIRYPYDDTGKLRDYFNSFFPNERQMETLRHIAFTKLEAFLK